MTVERPRLLANENFPAPSVALLRNLGYDLWSVREQLPGMHDDEVLRRAVADHRWILTFDLDYGELIFRRRLQPPVAIVLFRLAEYGPLEPGKRALEVLTSRQAREGGYFVVEPTGQRWRPFGVISGER